MSVRQQDIAEHLGLSVSTVSLALRDATQVSEETRVRVRDAATQLGYVYRPRPTLRTEIAQMAFITRLDPSNVFYTAVLSGAERECRSQDIALHYTRLEDLSPRARIQYSDAEALLVVGTIDEQTVLRLQGLGRPMVLIDNNLPHLGLDRVLIENIGSVYRLVRRLFSSGHRRIGFMAGPSVQPSCRERRLGYQAAIASLRRAPIELGCDSTDHGAAERAMTGWLATHREIGFSALVVFHDEAAAEVIHVLHDHGLHVPDDVAVTGFDDIELARLVRPALTTCHVYRELLGMLGVRRLIERSVDPDTPPLAQTVDTVIIERASARLTRS
jgi:DNA-binding LacI/PurR family transcriptional regulator